jgi:hypothetical protein
MENVAIIRKRGSEDPNNWDFLESFARSVMYKGKHYIERSPDYLVSEFTRSNADYFMKKYGSKNHEVITLSEANQILSQFKLKKS